MYIYRNKQIHKYVFDNGKPTLFKKYSDRQNAKKYLMQKWNYRATAKRDIRALGKNKRTTKKKNDCKKQKLLL